MECSKKTIEYAWDEICQKIHDGIELHEIHTISEIIRDLECIEEFIEVIDIESGDLKENSWLIKNIEEEISDVERYINKWNKTQNSQFKTIAKQEWEHAGSFIKMVDRSKITNEENIKLQQLINEYNDLLPKLT